MSTMECGYTIGISAATLCLSYCTWRTVTCQDWVTIKAQMPMKVTVEAKFTISFHGLGRNWDRMSILRWRPSQVTRMAAM